MNIAAQTTDTDQLPSRPVAERLVQEASAATAVAPATAVAADDDASAETIVRTALQYLGAKYRHGHSGPTSFDCSGFTSYVYRQEDISLSRSSRTQYTQGTPVKRISDLKKGDLVFFGGSKATRTVGHVGIVTDVDPASNNFKFVHASRSGVKVSDSNSAYYSRRYIGARRILAE